MPPKTAGNPIGWIVLGILAIVGIICCTWESPYGTTRILRAGLIMFAIYLVTYNIATHVPLRQTLKRSISIGIIVGGVVSWRMVIMGEVTMPELAIVLGALAVICTIGGFALCFFFGWLEPYSYSLTGNKEKEKVQ